MGIGELPPNPNQGQPKVRRGQIIEITVPVVRNTQLVVRFLKPPPPTWPTEVVIAGIVALLTTSLAAAFIARRVVQTAVAIGRVGVRSRTRRRPPRACPKKAPKTSAAPRIAFNAMTDQVSRTLESQRQLLSAVGHDLRTPITAMRINTEFVEDADIRARLETNLEELQELTEAVLSAARGVGWGQMRKIDLAALMESLCSDLDEMGEPVSWQAACAGALQLPPQRNPPRAAQSDRERHRLRHSAPR